MSGGVGTQDRYFGQEGHWSQELDPFRRALLRKAQRALPEGVLRVLEVGCGAGEWCRLVGQEGIQVVGLDRARAALQAGRGLRRVQADVGKLPFADAAFDVVAAQDVIEHLPGESYEQAWREMFRVARRGVLVICPNGEDLSFATHRCRRCGTEFHENGHLRRLDLTELSARAAAAGAAVELIFFGTENWPYYDAASARARHDVLGRRPTWELATCPACGASERGPYQGGSESLLSSVELGLHEEFQEHPGHWRRNRAKEIGVLLIKRGAVPRAPRAEELVSGPRRLVLSGPGTDEPLSASLVAWPRGLIACGSEWQAAARPIWYSSVSYLYREDQQWGEAELIGGRWARRFDPGRPGGHACFVLSGRELFASGIRVEYLDEAAGTFSVGVYDAGIQQYVPVGDVACAGDGQWKEAVFPVPEVLPTEWGYLCHLTAAGSEGATPVFRIGAGRPRLLREITLQPGEGGWMLPGIEYPEGLFVGEGIVALLRGEGELAVTDISLQAEGAPRLAQLRGGEWHAETPLFPGADTLDALPVSALAEARVPVERVQLLAMKAMWAQEASRRRESERVAMERHRREADRLAQATKEHMERHSEGWAAELARHEAEMVERATAHAREVREWLLAEQREVSEEMRALAQELRRQGLGAQQRSETLAAEIRRELAGEVSEVRGLLQRYALRWELSAAAAALAGRRVFHGPCNLGGGPYRLARAQRELGLDAVSVCYRSPVYRYPADETFAAESEIARLTPKQLDSYVAKYDVFHFYFGMSLEGLSLDDVARLKEVGKQVIFYFCGCDIKNPRVIREKYAINACRFCWPQRCNPNRARATELALAYADLIYVSTPDLHEFLPGSRLLQQPIDVRALRARLKASPVRRDRRPFVVAHSPTSRALKGTDFVLSAVEKLRARGLDVELRLIENMTYEQALAAYRDADLAVDQLLFGAYGQVSVEMMALGVPVVCYLREDVLPLYPEMPPIINADIYSLADVLAHYYEHPEELEPFRQRGEDYAERRHDSLALARQTLLEYAELLRAKGTTR
jgi:SAM-dependent methyltransferase/glycosyltransferase involved in cell wall biosynthesis